MSHQPNPDENSQPPSDAFPHGPAWAVGADREHRGPSGMGPGEDQPGFGQEIDEEDAAGVTGGFLRSQAEAQPAEEDGEDASSRRAVETRD